MQQPGLPFEAKAPLTCEHDMNSSETLDQVTQYLRDLQARICAGLEEADGGITPFHEDAWKQENGAGRTCILSAGQVFEQAGVNFSHVHGSALPAAASLRHPELGGSPF